MLSRSTLLGLSLVFLLGLPCYGFYSPQATEATLTFEHQVEFSHLTRPSEAEVRQAIKEQLKFSSGSMRGQGVMPRGHFESELLSLERQSRFSRNWVARYRSTATVLINSNTPGSSLAFILPNNPRTIYRKSIVINSSGIHFPCTHPHYISAGDFFYFWNPSRPGCPLREGQHYNTVNATYVRAENSSNHSPEYERLRVSADEGTIIPIHVFIGMNEPEGSQDPFTSQDENAQYYLSIRKTLLETGFSSQVLQKEPLQEQFSLPTPQGLLQIKTFFGYISLSKGQAFHGVLKEALETASLVLYNGHSGLGGNLDPSSIEAKESFSITLPRDRYQIFMWHGCSTYSYFIDSFFARKASPSDPLGHRNLEIISNAKSVGNDTFPLATLSMIQAVQKWATQGIATTYPELLSQMEHDDLISVSGEEDNP